MLARFFEGTCGPLVFSFVVLLFFLGGEGKCGQGIDPTKGKLWTTY